LGRGKPCLEIGRTLSTVHRRRLDLHYDGRVVLGESAQPLYAAVLDVVDVSPGKDKPFLFNDSDRWLEQDVETLVQDIRDKGSVTTAVKPILESFEDSFLKRT